MRGPGQVLAGRRLQGALLIQPHAADAEHSSAGEPLQAHRSWKKSCHHLPTTWGACHAMSVEPPGILRHRDSGRVRPKPRRSRSPSLRDGTLVPKAQQQGTIPFAPAAFTLGDLGKTQACVHIQGPKHE